MKNIEQLEHDIWILRGQLNDLRQQSPNMNDEIYRDRLNRLEFELHYMQKEVDRLKDTPINLQQIIRQSIPPNQLSGLIPESNINANINKISNSYPNNIQVPFPSIKKEKKKMDFEKTFGTGIMGIVASILVFISIIIFGSLLIPYLSEGVMVLLMFLASFTIAGIGYCLLQKNNTNKFNLSLCACGVTAICVSLFVTRIYFGFLDNFLFLFLIFVWMAMMAYLCKKNHYLFRIIGEIGILITCLLGLTEISFTAEWYSYIILVIIYGISSITFHYASPRESYEKNAFSHIIHTITIIEFAYPVNKLAIPFMGAERDILWIELFAMCMAFTILIALEIVIIWNEKINNGILFYVLCGIQMLTLSLVLSLLTPEADASPFMLISSIFLLYFFSRKQTKFNFIGDVCVNLFYLIGGLYLMECSEYCSLICVIPLLLYGIYKNRKIFLYGGLIGMTGIFFINDITIISLLFSILLPFILFLFLARKNKDGLFSTLGYAWMLICLNYGINEILYPTDFLYGEITVISFLFLAIIHIVIIKGDLLKNDSKIFEISSSIITGIFMIISIPMIYEKFLVVLVTLITIALFIINSRKLLEKSELFGYYIALKYTVLMLVILDVAWNLAIIYSICMLLFSLASIILGFMYNHKSFRIYGLLLSMISVFKLILFDVNGKSMTYNAFGFLICGLICFGISFVYNKIEQKLKKQK